MSEIIEEEERRKSIKVLDDLLEEFLEGRYSDFSLKFDKPLDLGEDEYFGLLGNFDSSGGADNIDVFTYDCGIIENLRTKRCFAIVKTLEIELDVQEGVRYIIYEIRGHTAEKETECKDKEGQGPMSGTEKEKLLFRPVDLKVVVSFSTKTPKRLRRS
jgi:hypothetical protein